MNLPRLRRGRPPGSGTTARGTLNSITADRHAGPHTTVFLRLFSDSGHMPSMAPARYQRSDLRARELMAVVAIDGIETLRKFPRDSAIYRDTLRWLTSEDTTWLYAFARICATFGLDADRARRAVLARVAA